MKIATATVEQGLAVCVQIDPPTESIYRWNGETNRDLEHRLWLKCLSQNLEGLRQEVFKSHPYDTPQWIVVEAVKVDEKYLKWAKETSNLRRF